MAPIRPTAAAASPVSNSTTLGPGSKGPAVRELKQLLADAGFYKGAINDELGPMGTQALVAAKQALKLGGAPDVAGPTTLAALKKAVAAGGAAGDFGAQLKSPNLSQTAIYRAIGMAEGTIAQNGQPTAAYTQHGDPGNQQLNKGFGSYQVYQHPKGEALTPQEADRVQADRLATIYPSVDRALTEAGFPAGANRNLIAANALDAWNQAPAVHGGTHGLLNPQRLGELKSALDRGADPIAAITDWRANGYLTDSGNLDAPGLGNSMGNVRADQRRRAEAVQSGLGAVTASPTSSPSQPSSWSPAAATPTADVEGAGTIASGATGSKVESLQSKLNALGAQLEVDGDFGVLTQAALKKFQAANGITADGVAGPQTRQTMEAALSRKSSSGNSSPGMPALNPATLSNLGTGSQKAIEVLQQGSTGPQVERLKKALAAGGFYDGVINDQLGAQGIDALVRAKAQLKLGGAPDQAGEFTLKHLEAYAASRGAGNVDSGNAALQTLATRALDNGETGMCVATTLNNMERLGVPNFPGGTSDDPNNPRGAMVRLLKTGDWESLPFADSKPRTIESPYGTVQAQVMSADAYEKLAKEGKVPSGAIIFQTRHGWDYSGGSSGNDMGIVRNGGRITHNYASMSPIIYSDARDVVLLVPKGSVR